MLCGLTMGHAGAVPKSYGHILKSADGRRAWACPRCWPSMKAWEEGFAGSLSDSYSQMGRHKDGRRVYATWAGELGNGTSAQCRSAIATWRGMRLRIGCALESSQASCSLESELKLAVCIGTEHGWGLGSTIPSPRPNIKAWLSDTWEYHYEPPCNRSWILGFSTNQSSGRHLGMGSCTIALHHGSVIARLTNSGMGLAPIELRHKLQVWRHEPCNI